MNFKFNNEIPGYACREECATICNIIGKGEYYNILEVGCFTGRLTWSLCQTFTDAQITVLDIWEGHIDFMFTKEASGPRNYINYFRDEKFINKRNTPEFFNSLQKGHTNLTAIHDNFYNYKETRHDVIILGADDKKMMHENLIDHALLLRPKLIIGRHARSNKPIINKALELYEIERFDPYGIYVVKNKKDTFNE